MAVLMEQYLPLDYVTQNYNIPTRYILEANKFCPTLIKRDGSNKLVNVCKLGLATSLPVYKMPEKGFEIGNNFLYFLNEQFRLKGWQRISSNSEIVLCEAVLYWEGSAQNEALNNEGIKGEDLHRMYIDYSQNRDLDAIYQCSKVKNEIQRNLKTAQWLINQFSLNIDQIWEQFHKTHNVYLRNLLIEHYRVIVKYCAKQLHSKLPDKVELNDLISAGIFGLIDAIDVYNPYLGIKFESYCTLRIKGSILDELRRMDWVPRLVRARAHQLARATHSLETILDREPTKKEIRGQLGMSMKEFNRLQRDANAVSLISLDLLDKDGYEKDSHIVYIIKDEKSCDPVIEAQKQELKNLITKGLTRAERLIIVLHYYEEMTMKETSRILDVSESRVSQMHSAIIARLKAKMYDKREEMLGRERLKKPPKPPTPEYVTFTNIIPTRKNDKNMYRYVKHKLLNSYITKELIEPCTFAGGRTGYRVHLSNIKTLRKKAKVYTQEYKRMQSRKVK